MQDSSGEVYILFNFPDHFEFFIFIHQATYRIVYMSKTTRMQFNSEPVLNISNNSNYTDDRVANSLNLKKFISSKIGISNRYGWII